MAIGPSDLSLGLDALREFQKMAKFPFLSANLVDATTGKPIFKDSVVIEKGGVRFGIFGVMMNRLNPTYAARALQGAKLENPYEAAKRTVAALKNSSDVIIALGQLNVPDNEKLLDEIEDIDILVDPLSKSGSKAIWVNADEFFTVHNGKPRLRIDGQGSRVGVFDMYFSADKNLSAHEGYDAPLEPHYMDHPDVVRCMSLARRGAEFGSNVPHGNVPLNEELLGQEGCGSCHEAQHKFWQGTSHAHTFISLEKTGDQKRMDCIGCHTLGYGISFIDPEEAVSFKEVQCENCHGVRSGHAENPRQAAFGSVPENTCWSCHNPTFTQKDFDYTGTLDRVSCPKIQR